MYCSTGHHHITLYQRSAFSLPKTVTVNCFTYHHWAILGRDDGDLFWTAGACFACGSCDHKVDHCGNVPFFPRVLVCALEANRKSSSFFLFVFADAFLLLASLLCPLVDSVPWTAEESRLVQDWAEGVLCPPVSPSGNWSGEAEEVRGGVSGWDSPLYNEEKELAALEGLGQLRGFFAELSPVTSEDDDGRQGWVFAGSVENPISL